MARLLRPVTRMISSRPEATASSTTYWMAGLSTTGSISLGCALVAGRKRVPRPAAGITALRTPGLIAPASSPHPRAPHGAPAAGLGLFDAVAAALLGPVEGGVGRRHQLGRRQAVVRIARHADGNGDGDRGVPDGEGLGADHFVDFRRQAHRP